MEDYIFNKARTWIYRNARPIDMARFQYFFEDGSKEKVLTVLAEYQNEDGGFGHALEADSFNPLSSPIQTWAATEILNEIDYMGEHPIINGILKYLESEMYFNGTCWLNSISSNNDYPSAPWWKYDSNSYSSINYNPTAALLGFVIKYGNVESIFYNKCYSLTKEAMKHLIEGDSNEMHLLSCYIRLAKNCCDRGLAKELSIDNLEKAILDKVNKSLTWNKELWKEQYVCKPSQFFLNKDCFLYEPYRRLAEYELDFIKNSQQSDGTWNINWAWTEDMEYWHIAKNWWTAHLIINNLRFLKDIL